MYTNGVYTDNRQYSVVSELCMGFLFVTKFIKTRQIEKELKMKAADIIL